LAIYASTPISAIDEQDLIGYYKSLNGINTYPTLRYWSAGFGFVDVIPKVGFLVTSRHDISRNGTFACPPCLRQAAGRKTRLLLVVLECIVLSWRNERTFRVNTRAKRHFALPPEFGVRSPP
jgi:hypothetical protein